MSTETAPITPPQSTPLTDTPGSPILGRTYYLFLQDVATALQQPSSGGGGSTTTTNAPLLISIPGTLGIGSNLAPPAFFVADTTLKNGCTCVVNDSPTGADLTIQVYEASGPTLLFEVTIKAGSTSTTVPPDGTVKVDALDGIIINITAVGTVFPGSDLTVALS